jgi:hypothetical protein
VHDGEVAGVEAAAAEGLGRGLRVLEVLAAEARARGRRSADAGRGASRRTHLFHGDVAARDDLADSLAVFGHVDELVVRAGVVGRRMDDSDLQSGRELMPGRPPLSVAAQAGKRRARTLVWP